MPNLIDIEKKDDYLVAVATGVYCLEDTVSHFQEILSACLEFKVQKVLLDFRQAQSKMSMADELIYLKRILQEYQPYLAAGHPPIKVAYLGPSGNVKPHSPTPKMGKDMGFDMTLTDDEAFALKWLAR